MLTLLIVTYFLAALTVLLAATDGLQTYSSPTEILMGLLWPVVLFIYIVTVIAPGLRSKI